MKTTIVSLTLVAALAFGCATKPQPSNGVVSTNTVSVANQNVDDVAFWLKSTAKVSVPLAVNKNKDARQYFVLVSAVLSTFVLGDVKDPYALSLALAQIKVKELNSVEAQTGIAVLTSAYELYYTKHVQGNINADAIKLLTALNDGVKEGLALLSDK